MDRKLKSGWRVAILELEPNLKMLHQKYKHCINIEIPTYLPSVS